MTLPTFATIESAVDDLYAAFNEDPTAVEARAGVEALDEVKVVMAKIYEPTHYCKSLDDFANAGAYYAQVINGNADIRRRENGPLWAGALDVGDILVSVDGTDFLSGEWATDKGGAVAAGDLFQAITQSTFLYLGNLTPDFSGTNMDDFINL